MALLTVRNLVMEYDGKAVLQGINLDLDEGQLKVVMGPSGCGKSTLLRCLNRLVTPTSGQVIFRGEDVTRPDTDVRALRQRIGFVFQNFALYRHLSALENVTLALRKLRHMPAAGAAARAKHELRRMDMVEHHHKYPAQLSGGQKQRVAIARALVTQPGLVLADEPTANLDYATASMIIALMKRMQSELQTTFLFSTHDTRIIGAVETIYTLEDGHLVGCEREKLS